MFLRLLFTSCECALPSAGAWSVRNCGFIYEHNGFLSRYTCFKSAFALAHPEKKNRDRRKMKILNKVSSVKSQVIFKLLRGRETEKWKKIVATFFAIVGRRSETCCPQYNAFGAISFFTLAAL